MRNCRTNWSVASLDAIEKPRDLSHVLLLHFAAEPHNNLDALRGGGGGEGGRERERDCFIKSEIQL